MMRLSRAEKWWLIGSVAFTLSCTALWAFHWAAVTTPSLICDHQVKQLGPVEMGSVVHEVYELINTGAVPVRIVELTKSCGCLDAHASSTEVVPGDTTRIHVSYRIDVLGDQKREVLVRTNDPARSQMRLILVCTGVPVASARNEVDPTHAGVMGAVTFEEVQP